MIMNGQHNPQQGCASGLSCLFSRFYFWLHSLSGFKRQSFSFCIGALMALALPPFYVLPLLFFSFPVFVWLLDSLAAQSYRRFRALTVAALTGWSFGFGYFTASLWWLGDAMMVDFSHFWWAIPFAVFGLPAFLALYYGLAAAFAFLFWRPGLTRVGALAISFAIAEYLRGILWTGFPWNAIGLTIMPCPLFMQADAVLTHDGMNLLAVFLAGLPALWAKNPLFNSRAAAKYGLLIGLCLVSADIGFGAYRLYFVSPPAKGKILRIRLVQPAIAQEEKQSPLAAAENFSRLLELSYAPPKDGGSKPQLIIWPETAMPFLPDYDRGALRYIGARLQKNQLLLAGAIRTETMALPLTMTKSKAETHKKAMYHRYFNAMMLINASGQILGHADKVHLVPFGEYLPLEHFFKSFGLTAIARAAGPYSAGKTRHFIQLPDGTLLLPLICYEAIFPQASAPIKGQKPAILVNITNDAWFGDTPGPYQHFAQARLRAIEQNRPLIRAANTGISAYIDSKGRIKAELPLNTAGFLDIDVPI